MTIPTRPPEGESASRDVCGATTAVELLLLDGWRRDLSAVRSDAG